MKLMRCGVNGHERPAVLMPDGSRADVSAFGEDYTEAFFGTGGVSRLAAWLGEHAKHCPRIGASVRLGPCIARPSKIVCVGLNFRDHARESNLELPKEPVLFFKSTTALCGPNDDVIIPRGSNKTDWEVELAVVIGQRASYVDEADALNHVAGYALHNDYSEREFQIERAGQWVKGKSCDTFAPLGPYLATRDEFPNTDALAMWLTVNGKSMQHGTSSDMVFKVPFLVSYISQFMTLLPGDVISTGTPAGVGLGMKPPLYLKAGDVVELGIEGLGQARQRLVEWSRD
jgi:2-keto-4-pentenoate hydratase/2-oxohepta-3-ene-1,7-dioic acid hydratase in catechol pathway